MFNNAQISYFMKTHLVVAELFNAERHDEGNSRSSQVCELT
jgi:hypothetical protein